MRLAGTVAEEPAARRFADYLRTLSIESKVEGTGGQWSIWVRDERDLARGRNELAEFLADPAAERYAAAVRSAEALRKEDAERDRATHRRHVDMRERWHVAESSATLLTFLLIAGCLGVAVLTGFGRTLAPIDEYLFITPIGRADGRIFFTSSLDNVAAGEVWRLVTPIFIHFDPLHLVGNMIWLFHLGGVVEARRGVWRLALLVLLTAVASNLVQFYFSGPYFGGMSGVNFALFGFVWMRSRFDPGSNMFLPPPVVAMMILWFLLCMTGVVGNVANEAHAVGLAIGLVVGFVPPWLRRMRR